MLSWIKNKGGRDQQTRRAFRPGTDRLESREVLSTFPTFANGTAVTIARPLASPAVSNAAFNIFTAGMQTGRAGFQVFAPSTNSRTVALNPRITSTAAAVLSPSTLANNTLANNVTTTARSVANAVTSRVGTTAGTRTLPRLGGFNPNVNPNVVNRFGLAGTTFTGSNNPALTNSAGVLSGLAFTNGLGFTNNTSRFSVANSALNGLAFTNGTGFSTPARTTNSASNGLAFTNGAGFSVPAGRLSTSTNNAASTGLAFSNGQGGTLPARLSPFFNPSNNGLTFTGGLGFTNPSNNPFLRGTVAVPGTTIANTSSGLGSSLLTIGNSGVFANQQPMIF